MCVSNVNANISLIKAIENVVDIMPVSAPIENVPIIEDDGKFVIGGFIIKISLNLIESNETSRNKQYNVINNNGILKCYVHLISIESDEETSKTLYLDEFNLDFSNKSLIIDQCKNVRFCNYEREIPVSKIELPSCGSNTFVVQLLVQRFVDGTAKPEDTIPVIQSMYKFKATLIKST